LNNQLSIHIFKNLIKVILLLLSFITNAQSPQFSQYYASPVILNPALSGAMEMHGRANLNFRNQWSLLPGSITSIGASFDYKLEKQNSGIGVVILNDNAGVGNLSTSLFGISYAYNLALNEDWNLRSGILANYTTKSIDVGNYNFADAINSGLATQEVLPKTTVGYADIQAGLVLHNEDFWLGISGAHLAMPSYSFFDSKIKLPVRMSLQTGYKFHTLYHKSDLESFFMPVGMLRLQGNWLQTDLGMYWHHSHLLAGIWYRGIPALKNNDAVVLMAGFTTHNFNFCYSVDIGTSRLGINAGVSHELSLSFQFGKTGPTGKRDFGLKKYSPFPRF
jgi:type IX secretion system PorP/SprF family membrane protein